VGEARDRGRGRAAAQEVITVDEVDRPRRVPGRSDDGVELVLLQHRFQPLLATELAALVERVAIGLIGERPLLLRLHEQVLPEIGHLAVPVTLIEVDDVLQRLNGRTGRELREVAVQVGLELVQQDGELGVIVFPEVGNVRRVHDDGTACRISSSARLTTASVARW